MITVSKEEDLVQALKQDVKKIELIGDFVPEIRRLKRLNEVMWCLCMSMLVLLVAVVLIIPVTDDQSKYIDIVTGTRLAAILGVAGACLAIRLAVSGSGIHVLKALRSFKERDAGKYSDKHRMILYRP